MSLENSRNGKNLMIIPDSVSLTDETSYGGLLARANSYTSATPEGPYTPGQQIQISLPREMLSFENMSLQFTIAGTPGVGSTYTRFSNNIKSIFSRITVAFGSKIVLDQQNYNLVSSVNSYTRDPQWQDTNGKICYGTGTPAERNANFANPNLTYAIQLYDFWNEFYRSYWFFQKLGVQCIITLYLANPSECIECDAGLPTYVLNNCQLHYSTCVPSITLNNMFDEKVRSEYAPTNTYMATDVQRDSSTCIAGISNFSKVLTYKYSSLLGIFVVFRPLATVSSLAFDGKLDTFTNINISSAQLRIGSMTYPLDSKSTNSDKYTMFAELFGQSMTKPMRAGLNWNTSSFILCFPLSKFPFESRASPKDIIEGLNTAISTQIVLNISTSVPLPVAYEMDIVAQYNNTLSYTANGGITWND